MSSTGDLAGKFHHGNPLTQSDIRFPQLSLPTTTKYFTHVRPVFISAPDFLAGPVEHFPS